jgi:hypothetical protein
MVRRSLASLDPALGDPDRQNDALVLGMHFGRDVEIEYENEPASPDPSEAVGETELDEPSFGLMHSVHRFRSTGSADYHFLRVSRKKYDAWIAEQMRWPGESPPKENRPLIHHR